MGKMKICSKRILAVLLSAAMLVTMLPAFLLPTLAEEAIEPETEVSYVLGTGFMSDSVLPNGTFDSTSGWNVAGNTFTATTSIAASSGSGVDGTSACKVSKGGIGGKNHFQFYSDAVSHSDAVSISGGVTYQFGASVKSDSAVSLAYIELVQSTGTKTRSTTVQGTTADWAHLSGIITLDAATTSVQLYFHFERTDGNDSTDVWYVDNAYLIPTTDALASDTLNTTFDSGITGWVLGQANADDIDGINSAAFRQETEIKRTGNGSLYVGKDNLNQTVYIRSTAKTAVTAGKKYTWGAWLASHDSNTAARMDMVVYDESGAEIAVLTGRETMLSRADTLSAWTKVATTAAMPVGAAAAAYRLVLPAGRSQVFVDDIFSYDATDSLPIGSVTAGELTVVNELLAGYTYTANLGGTLRFVDLNGKELTSATVSAGESFTVPASTVETGFTPSASGNLSFTQIATPSQDDAGWTSQVVWYPEEETGDGVPKLVFFRSSIYIGKSVSKAVLQIAATNTHKTFYVSGAGGLLYTYVNRSVVKETVDANNSQTYTPTVTNAGKGLDAYTYDVTANLKSIGTHVIASSAWQSGDNNHGGLIWQMDVVYADGSTERFGTGLTNTTTTAYKTTECGNDPNGWYGNNSIEGKGWFYNTQSNAAEWTFIPAQNRGTPPLSGGIGSVAYDWDYNYVTARPTVNMTTSAVALSATAGQHASFVAPFTGLTGTLPKTVRARLYKDGAYVASASVKLASDSTGAANGNGLLKASFTAPDYLPAGTYSLCVYESDLGLIRSDNNVLATVTLTAAGKAPISAAVTCQDDSKSVETELDVNGGFETLSADSTIPANWDLNTNTTLTSKFAQSGESYLKLERTSTSKNPYAFTSSIAVSPNTEYVVTYWKYSELKTQTYLTFSTGATAGTWTTNTHKGTGNVATEGWKQYSYTITTGADVNYARIQFAYNEGATDEAKLSVSYIDNVTFATTADPNTNLLPSGDFEVDTTVWTGANGASIATDGVHSGEHGLKLDRADGATQAVLYSHQFAVEPSTDYVVTYWKRSDTATQTYLRPYEFTGTGSVVSGGKAYNTGVIATSGWQQYSASFTTSAETAKMRLDFYNNAGTGIAYIDDIVVTKVSTVDDNDVVLTVNGKEQSPMLYLRPFGTGANYYDRAVLSAFAESDVTLYATYGGYLGDPSTTGRDFLWNDDGSVNYGVLDKEIYEILDINPNALVMVNLDVDAPDWWKTANPDECYTYVSNKTTGATSTSVSFASTKYRTEASAIIAEIVNYLYTTASYRHRIFGIRLTGGCTYEWMMNGYDTNSAFDDSAAMLAALNEKLGGTSYDSAAVKTAVKQAGNVALIDTTTTNGQIAYAYNTLLSESVSASLLAYAQAAKENCGNAWIVGGYNGYLWNFTSAVALGAAHTSMDTVLSSDYIDFICSPFIYGERNIGEYPAGMAMSESVAAHGKLYILEQDNRTYLATDRSNDNNAVGKTDTLKETIDQLTRDMSVDLVKNNGFWMFDMQGGWFSDPAITARIAQIKAEYEAGLKLNKGSNSEIAVIVGDDTYDYLANDVIDGGNGSSSTYLMRALYEAQRAELAKLGTSYDTLALSDLTCENISLDLSQYKLFIVLSPFGMTTAQADVLKTAAADGNTILWVYMPGQTADNISAITGMTATVGTAMAPLQATWTAASGDTYSYGAATYASGPKVTVSTGTAIAAYADGTTAAATLTADGYTSVYSAVPNVPANLLRKLCDDAGVHRYTEDKDAVVESNNSYVSVTTHVGGEITVNLPDAMADLRIYDVLGGEYLANNSGSVMLTLAAGETALLRMADEEIVLPVEPIDHGGDAELSAGATNLIAGGAFSAATTWTKSGEFATEAAVEDGMLRFNGDTTGGNYLVAPSVKPIPGATYTLSYYYWVADAASTATVRVRVLSADSSTSANNDKAVFTGSETYDITTANTNGWVRVEKTFTLADDFDTTTYPSMRVWFYNSQTVSSTNVGTVYFDDISLVCDQQYIGIDFADQSDNFVTIYYNTNQSAGSRDNVEITNDLPLSGMASSVYYGLYGYLNDTRYDMYIMRTGATSKNLYVYFADTADDPSTTKMKSAANGSIFVIPAGTKLTKATSDTTVYFVQDFVLEKVNGVWMKKVTVTDHTTDQNGGVHVPSSAVGENLVANSGFATDLSGYNTNGKGLIVRDEAGYAAFNGISGSAGDTYDYLYFTPTGVQAGKTYELSYYIWVTDATGLSQDLYMTKGVSATGAWLDQALKKGYNGTVDGSIANTGSLAATTAGWTLVTYQWTVPETATLSGMQIGIRSYGAGLSTFYVDDIALYEVEPQMKGASLTLSDKIHVNYHAALPDLTVKKQDVMMKFSYTGKDGAETVWVALDENNTANGYYVFTLENLVAAYMATTVTAELGYGTEDAFTVADSMNYSVRDYADALIDGNYTAAEKAAAKALVNYGAATQTYFGHNDSDLANSVLAEADKLTDIATALAKIDNINQYKATTTNKLASFVGYSLRMTDGVALRLYFTEQVTVTVDGETVAVVDDPDSDRYYAEIAGVSAAELDTAHEIVVNGTMTISNLSVLTPARTVARSSSQSANFRALCAAMILYAQSVNNL